MTIHTGSFSTKTRTLARKVRQLMKKGGASKRDIDVVACVIPYGKSFNTTALAGALANLFKAEIVYLREKKPTDNEMKEKEYIYHSYDDDADSNTVYTEASVCGKDYKNKNVLIVVDDVGDGKIAAASCELLEHCGQMRVAAVATEEVKTFLEPTEALDEWSLVYLNETHESPRRGRKRKN